MRLRELERDAEAVRGVYESFLERSRQTSAQVTLEETQARIIAKATPPLYPSSPNRKLNLFVGVMLALTLGGAAVFAAETFDSGLRKTVAWYLAHEDWWQAILERRYQGERLGLAKAEKAG